MAENKFIIGIDLGGTNLKIAVLDQSYNIRHKNIFPTKSFRDKKELIEALIGSIEKSMRDNRLTKRQVSGIGLGVPGPLNYNTGAIYFFPNIPGWDNVNLKKILEKRLKLPVFLDNDANLMALAEHQLGAAKGKKYAVCLTLGTGVGGGIIAEGKLYRGADNVTGEIGHLPINENGPRCNCKGIACLEAYIGNARILGEAKRAFGRKITLEKLSQLASNKNIKALKIWNKAAERLGIALTGVINLLNPECIIIGGGVANAGKTLFDTVKRTIKRRAMPIQARRAKIYKAKLGNDAGIIGAAIMVKEGLKIVSLFVLLSLFFRPAFAQEAGKAEPKEPIIVNGDVVEYLTDNKEVSATGNVSVTYKGSKLTCEKLTVNTETKEGVAEGNARVDDKGTVIEGSKITYNFNTKAGTIIDSNFRSDPYFGKAETVKKVSDSEFLAMRGYMTTCNYDTPHYRINSKEIDFFPQDKVIAKGTTAYAKKMPLLYLPRYSHSLKDPVVHVQMTPGKSKDWGPFLLTAWRYKLTNNITGRIYFDYREKKGTAQGFGANYDTSGFGKGDYKYYYMQERPRNFLEGEPAEFQRYFIRWRHQWDIDPQTGLTAEYYKITDSKRSILGSDYSILKDYFYREYEKNTQPASYALLHHNFTHSSLDFTMQKRTNRWYNSGYIEKLPEISYSLPSYQLFSNATTDTPLNLYFTNTSSAGNLNRKNTSTSTPAANDTNPDMHVNRLDASNKLSLPMKVAFIQFTPFATSRQTFYDKYTMGLNGAPDPRTIFYSGADISTKFYRIFNAKSDFLKMDIQGLRHIITPTIAYSFNHEPTVSNTKLVQIDGVDSAARSNAAALSLSNKLQTKRNQQSVDFLDFITSSTYTFKPKPGDKRGSSLSDILFELKMLPYSWMSINANTTYTRAGERFTPRYHRFANANYDINFNFAAERTIAIGQRYQIKGGNEITYDIDWRLSPKWKLGLYQRYNRGHDPALKRGLREQEYSIARDLHCWSAEINYNVRRGSGETVWVIFRLKAFPELEFEFNQSYHAPKPGSQSNP